MEEQLKKSLEIIINQKQQLKDRLKDKKITEQSKL